MESRSAFSFRGRSQTADYVVRRLLASIVVENSSTVRIGFPSNGTSPSICEASRTRLEVGILYFLHVVPSFAERRNTMGPVDRAFACIVRRQGHVQVAIIAVQQGLEIMNTAVDILLRVEDVIYAEPARCSGN